MWLVEFMAFVSVPLFLALIFTKTRANELKEELWELRNKYQRHLFPHKNISGRGDYAVKYFLDGIEYIEHIVSVKEQNELINRLISEPGIGKIVGYKIGYKDWESWK